VLTGDKAFIVGNKNVAPTPPPKEINVGGRLLGLDLVLVSVFSLVHEYVCICVCAYVYVPICVDSSKVLQVR